MVPAGSIESRLIKVLTDKRLGTMTTNRNWNTVTKCTVWRMNSRYSPFDV